jgi:hypothetical protein
VYVYDYGLVALYSHMVAWLILGVQRHVWEHFTMYRAVWFRFVRDFAAHVRRWGLWSW